MQLLYAAVIISSLLITAAVTQLQLLYHGTQENWYRLCSSPQLYHSNAATVCWCNYIVFAYHRSCHSTASVVPWYTVKLISSLLLTAAFTHLTLLYCPITKLPFEDKSFRWILLNCIHSYLYSLFTITSLVFHYFCSHYSICICHSHGQAVL